MEILAPAGRPEALKAAVLRRGGRGVPGREGFGARASAQNFSREEPGPRRAVLLPRPGGAGHVTVNHDRPAGPGARGLDFVRYLCSLPVDAVLIQDMGAFLPAARPGPGAAPARLHPDEPAHPRGG